MADTRTTAVHSFRLPVGTPSPCLPSVGRRHSFATPFFDLKHVLNCPDECASVAGCLSCRVGQECVVTDPCCFARDVRPVGRVCGMLGNKFVGVGGAGQ